MRERMIEMKCWWDDMELQQRWAMQTEKKRACLLWDSGEESICCPSGWLSCFPAVQQCIVSLPHTFTPKALLPIYLFIYFAVPSFSPTLSQINLCPALPLCGRLKQPPSKHTQLYCSSQLPSDEIPPPSLLPQNIFLPHGNPNRPVHSLMLIFVFIWWEGQTGWKLLASNRWRIY